MDAGISIRQIELIKKGAGFILNSYGQILSSAVNIEIDSSLRNEAVSFTDNLPENGIKSVREEPGNGKIKSDDN